MGTMDSLYGLYGFIILRWGPCISKFQIFHFCDPAMTSVWIKSTGLVGWLARILWLSTCQILRRDYDGYYRCVVISLTFNWRNYEKKWSDKFQVCLFLSNIEGYANTWLIAQWVFCASFFFPLASASSMYLCVSVCVSIHLCVYQSLYLHDNLSPVQARITKSKIPIVLMGDCPLISRLNLTLNSEFIHVHFHH